MDIELQEDHVYTLKEFKEFLGVTDSTWEKNKDRILKNFKSFYEFEYRPDPKDKRKKEIYIIKKLREYIKYSDWIKKRDEAFENGIIDIIKKDNVQTAVNINRNLRKEVDFIRENYTENTSYEYVRIRMKEYFGKKKGEGGTKGYIARKLWCDRKSTSYEPLSEEKAQIFFEYVNKYVFTSKERLKEIIDICLEYDHKLITKEERDDYLGDSFYFGYVLAKAEFCEKFDVDLICVPEYVLY